MEEQQTNPQPSAQPTENISPKSRLAAALFCGFLGYFGVHRFYVRKIGTGILMIVTFGGFGIWQIIDLINICLGNFRDKEGRRLKTWIVD